MSPFGIVITLVAVAIIALYIFIQIAPALANPLSPGEERKYPKEAIRQAKEQMGPSAIWLDHDVRISGTSHKNGQCMMVCKVPFENWSIVIEPEPDNKYDHNALAVVINDWQVGYIPRELAAEIVANDFVDKIRAIPNRIYRTSDGNAYVIDICLVQIKEKLQKTRKNKSRKKESVAQCSVIYCPRCEYMILVTDEMVGLKVCCPNCGQHIIVE